MKVEIIPAKNGKDQVGLEVTKDNIKIYVPEAFRYDEANETNNYEKSYEDILLLLDSIDFGAKKNKEIFTNGKNGNAWPFESYVWIIKDYLDNGFYFNRDRKYSVNSGKIDWKRTMKKSPVISNGNVIYTELITYNNSPLEGDITTIYKYCLDLALQRIGWLLKMNGRIDFVNHLVPSEMKMITNKELSNTFDDIKRLRFKYMLSILNGIDDDKASPNEHTCIVENYDKVFELMVDEKLGNIADLTQYNPKATYHLDKSGNSTRNKRRPYSPLSIDTLYRFKDDDGQTHVVIIDSKLYSYGMTHNPINLPGTDSIQKQVTYGDYISTNVKDVDYLKNMFISPYNKEDNSFGVNENYFFYGYHTADWRTNEKDHEFVLGYFIDFNYLLHTYKTKSNEIKKMYEDIKKNLQESKEDYMMM